MQIANGTSTECDHENLRARDFLKGFDELRAGVPLFVSLVKQLRANDAGLIEHECCWVRNAHHPLRRFFIADAVSVYGLAAVVGQ